MKKDLQNIFPHYFDWLCADLNEYEIVFINDPKVSPLHCKLPQVIINTYIGEVYGYEFLRNVIIHELYHVAVQGIYNATEMQSIRTQFSEIHGYTADVEADLVAFVYLHRYHNVTFTDFYLAQYHGRECFMSSNKKQKWYYYNRCIASLLSIFCYGLTGVESTMSVDLATVHSDGMLPIYRNEQGRSIYTVVPLPDLHYYQKFVRIHNIDFKSFENYYNEMTNVALEILERMGLWQEEMVTKVNNH